MTNDERIAAIRRRMAEEKLELIVAVHDGTHFIETPDPVMVLTGFKALGATATVLGRDGDMQLVVTPAWDAERANEDCPGVHVVGAADVVEGLASLLGRNRQGPIGIAGIPFAPWRLTKQIDIALPDARPADSIVFSVARIKTAEEIANAREATRIAEAGFAHLLEIARPGVSEDELAAELKWHSRSLGAEGQFSAALRRAA